MWNTVFSCSHKRWPSLYLVSAVCVCFASVAHFRLFFRGSGEFQHLGHGEEEHVKVPKLVARLSGEKIVKLSVGSHHTLALAESGNLYGWGKNTDGEVDGSGENIPLPKLLPNASKQGVMYIACGLHEVSITRSLGKGLLPIDMLHPSFAELCSLQTPARPFGKEAPLLLGGDLRDL